MVRTGPAQPGPADPASRREAYRAYQQRLIAYNCSFAADIHNATTAAQRQQAVKKFKGWEDDLRLIAIDKPLLKFAASSQGRSGPSLAAAQGLLICVTTRRGLVAALGKSFIAASNIAGSRLSMVEVLPLLVARVS